MLLGEGMLGLGYELGPKKTRLGLGSLWVQSTEFCVP